MSDAGRFKLTMQLQDNYRFLVDFGEDGISPLLLDEPAPLDEASGPSASRVVAAALGNCLSASLLYCLRKARVEVDAMHTSISGSLERNEIGRLRIGGIRVQIEPVVAESQRPRVHRCLELFEDLCAVTESVRDGIDIGFVVEDR